MKKRFEKNPVRPQTTTIKTTGHALPTTEGSNALNEGLLTQHETHILEVTKTFMKNGEKYTYIGVRFKKVPL